MVLKDRVAPTALKCPRCGTHNIRRTNRHRGWIDRLLTWINIYPYRCLDCPDRKRFYRFGRNN
jgi:ssDNA-binding Zn-finger/Zn-ribbon topoisomerase 1